MVTCLKTKICSIASQRSVVQSLSNQIRAFQLTIRQGQINIHRTHLPSAQASPPTFSSVAETSQSAPTPHASVNAVWRTQRAAPYPLRRARAGRMAPTSHRHRSLVLNKKTNQPSDTPNEVVGAAQKEAFVTKHDRHFQLINTSIYDKEIQQRHKAIEETRRQKVINRDQREQQKIQQHIQANVPRAANGIYQITINGIHFSVINDGTKLERTRGRCRSISQPWIVCLILAGPSDSTRPTPKQADVGGVKFFRTSNGNLLRNGIFKAKK